MSRFLVMNIVTGEEAAMFPPHQRDFADKLVAILRKSARAKKEVAPDAWTVVELSTGNTDGPAAQ